MFTIKQGVTACVKITVFELCISYFTYKLESILYLSLLAANFVKMHNVSCCKFQAITFTLMYTIRISYSVTLSQMCYFIIMPILRR